MSTVSRRSRLLAAGRPEEGTAALAARFGAPNERPALRKDLIVRRLVRMGEVKYVIKDVRINNYYNFDDADMDLIRLFDGTRTLHEIRDAYQAEFPNETVEMDVVLDYCDLLRKVDLLEQSATERHLTTLAGLKTARQRAAEEKAEGFNIFFLLFHVLDPDRFLNRTKKYVRWLWTPPAVAVGILCFGWAFGVIALHWTTIWSGTEELYAFLRKPFVDILQFFFILTLIGCVHEFAHAYTTKFYGGEVHDIGIALLYFAPAFYCDTTDSILFENRWHSLWVTLAGIYIEAWMCFIAVVLWVASYPDTLIHELAFKTILFTGVSSVFFNINPLIKIDGYYALASTLQIPELREESFAYVGAAFQRNVLRLPVEVPEVSRRKRRIYWTYGLLALAYVGVLMSFIGGLFYNLYDKYFPNFAVVLLLLTMYRMFRKRVRLITRTTRLFYLDKKELLMSRRTRKPMLVAAAVLALVFFVPWGRRSIASPIVLRPRTTVRLEAPEDSVVAKTFKREGELVRPGEEVFRLASPDSAEASARLAIEHDRLEKEASRARALAEPAAVRLSEQQGASVEAALRNARSRDERLSIQSPIAGRILTPYIEQLEGRVIPAGDLLAEVGDVGTVVAELPVSERLLDDLELGAPVTALFPRSLRPARGSILSVSAASFEQPKTASVGPAPVAPSEHPERFVVRAVFENADGRLLPGMAGEAKIYGRRASYASRTFRILKRWVQSIVW